MSYQVIARKYRPQRFADVVGQEHVSDTLANAIKQNRIAHAYLFCGPRGTGKTTLARIFAKALNATGGPNADFKLDDPKCVEIAEGRSIDVLEIDGASNNGVEQVRELRDTVKYAPASSKFKIYIIDEVHMLSTAAFNALLKTLEEPPEHVKFFFATTDPEKVLPTILSRCQRFDLRRIPVPLIVKHLKYIAKNEGVAIDDPALHAVARGAEGCMRDAESTLDQLISFCGNKIEEPDVLSMFGLAAQAQILELARAVLAGEVSTALRQLNDLSKGGKDLGRLLSDLLNHFRNLLIYLVSKGDLTMLEVSESEAELLKQQSSLATPDTLGRIMEVLADAEMRLRDATSKKILLEVALLRAIEARNALPIDTVLKQLNQLRESGGGAPTPAPARPAPAPMPAPVAPAPSAPPVATVAPEPARLAETPVAAPPADLESLWSSLVDAAGRASPFIRGYLSEAHPVSFAKNVFIIGFDPEFADHISLIDNSKNHTLLATKMAELGHHGAQFKFIKAEAPANRVRPATPAPTPAAPAAAPKSAPKAATADVLPPAPAKPKSEPVPFNQDEFKNDPLIQKALEVFKGRIVEVRA
ncbi:MAG: polymerase subunit gamma/tau [Verrucomicrobiota bacterium]|jgi:DNA polymerase-3 subunit gamma/tau